ncbi:hypothetical protein JTB14_032912 [Gonioctena quinquepunctata]|nr:hypothetical protein JTB14_032912 [Gonioctena quinquepunctata]
MGEETVVKQVYVAKNREKQKRNATKTRKGEVKKTAEIQGIKWEDITTSTRQRRIERVMEENTETPNTEKTGIDRNRTMACGKSFGSRQTVNKPFVLLSSDTFCVSHSSGERDTAHVNTIPPESPNKDQMNCKP